MDGSDDPTIDSRPDSAHQKEKDVRDQQKRRRVMRDVLQKKVHNVVEQKRKAKMAAWIQDINSLLPKSDPRKESINLVLERAYEFMLQLKQDNDKLLAGRFSEVEKSEFQKLRDEVTHLKEQNDRYVKLLKLAGISPSLVPPDLSLVDQPLIRRSGRFASDEDSSCTSEDEEELVHCRRRRLRRRKSCGRKCQSDVVNGSNNSPQVVVIRADLPAVLPAPTPTPAITNEVPQTDQNGSASNLILSSNLLQTGATYILTPNGQLLPVAQVVSSESTASLAGGTNCNGAITPFATNTVATNHAQPALQANGQSNTSAPVVPIIATSSHNFHVSSLLNDGTNSSADANMPLDPIENTQVGSRMSSSCNTGSNEFFNSMGQSNSQSMRISYRSNNFHVNNLLTDTTPASDPSIQSSVPIEAIEQNQMSNRVPTFCSSNSSEYYQPRGQSSHSSNSFRTQNSFRSNNFHVNNLLTDVSSSSPVVETSVHSGPAGDLMDKGLNTSRGTSASYNSNQSDYYQNRGQSSSSSWMNPMSRW